MRVFTDSRGVGSPASFKVRAEKSGAASTEASGPNWLVLGGLALIIVAGIGGVVALVKRPSGPAPAPAAPVQETTQA